MTLFGGLAGFAVDAFSQAATLRRWPVTGWQSNGVLDETAGVTTTAIQAVIQAPSESDMRLVPEGERAEAWVTIWSRTALRGSDEATGVRADEITGADGQSYRVVRAAQRTEGGFTRVIARLARDNPERGL